jgi:uncharacterized membrane protein
VLAYLGWWVTGGLLLFLERRQPFVRFHAAQAFFALGALWLAGLAVHGAAYLMLSVSARAFGSLLWLSYGIWAVGVGLWLVGIVGAARGERWRIPLAARAADWITRTS